MYHPTIEEQNKDSYIFLKKLYWDLMLNLKKKGDDKSVEFLKNSWQEIEKQYQN
jgi:hypothetical protein